MSFCRLVFWLSVRFIRVYMIGGVSGSAQWKPSGVQGLSHVWGTTTGDVFGPHSLGKSCFSAIMPSNLSVLNLVKSQFFEMWIFRQSGDLELDCAGSQLHSFFCRFVQTNMMAWLLCPGASQMCSNTYLKSRLETAWEKRNDYLAENSVSEVSQRNPYKQRPE